MPEVDLLETEEEEFTGLDVDFLDQDFLVDILAQLNKQLAIQMRSEFDKKSKSKTGTDEFGVTLLDEEPEWVWMRSDEAGNNTIVEPPISFTVIAKSVPLTAIVAVGVFIFTFCAEFLAI